MATAKFHQQRKVIVDLLSSAQSEWKRIWLIDMAHVRSEDGDLDLFKKTIEAIQASGTKDFVGIMSEYKDGNKRTALHFAAASGRRKVLSYILERAASCINEQDDEGATPLNEFAAVKLLLDAGADATIAKTNGLSALHQAAANGSIRTCRLLLEKNADLEARTMNGTALHFAVSEDRQKTVEELLKRGANVNALNEKGVTPLILSCLKNSAAVAKELLVGNADLTPTIMAGMTALHIAAEVGFADVVKEFIETRKDDTAAVANVKSEAGLTPIQLAAGSGHREVVELLKPLSTGFESTNVDQLMKTEKAKVESYREELKKKEKADLEAQAEAAKLEKFKAAGGIVAEEDVVVPEAVPVDEETTAKAVALKEQGNKAYVAKDFARAIELYSLALELTPADPLLYSNRCAAYLGAGEAKKALHDVRVSKKLKPDWAKAWFREGQCLEALNLFEEAAYAMWQAILLAPGDAMLEKRFKACVERGRTEHQAKQKAEKEET
ncbi:TPA: hypothetical protein N0F65_004951 [Lagenidium giganteum]|uniref:Uncharacterized protein n=1 Tax=Lagenidium giganteum TaxID=4803 RepID=A0AAV2YYJ3_9STRA|nr:TPA: hypothetical protein N0F65_004951 [Lagenidium giganteum]